MTELPYHGKACEKHFQVTWLLPKVLFPDLMLQNVVFDKKNKQLKD